MATLAGAVAKPALDEVRARLDSLSSARTLRGALLVIMGGDRAGLDNKHNCSLSLQNTLAGSCARARLISDPTLTPVFESLPWASFVLNGATLPHDSWGAELRFANGIALLARFDGEFASRSSTDAGTSTIRYTW